MDEPVLIIGHKNPDTDSICSVIAYAELKTKLGINALAKRLGDINKETAFVLKYFDVEVPEYLSTVQTQISDLDIDSPSPISPDVSIKKVWDIMKKNNMRTLPVVDENDRLLGVVSVSDITMKYMDFLDNTTIFTSEESVRSVAETLNGEIIYWNPNDFQVKGKVLVAASDPDCLVNYVETGDIVITGNRKDSQLESIRAGAKCLIITCGGEMNSEVLHEAENSNCIVIITPMDTIETVRLINQSISVDQIMNREKLIKFNINDYIEDIQDVMLKTRYRSYPVVDNNNIIKGFIARYHIITNKKKKLILLDHNEKSQTVAGIEDAEILEIIDHHRMGDIQTPNPIYIKNEPLGSTATIIAGKYFETGLRPSKKIAGILCAAILSDTLKLQSPTSTHIDEIAVEKLAAIAGIEDLDSFANVMFKEGSSLEGKTPEDIFFQDYKEYEFDGQKLGIGQIITMDKDHLEETKKNLLEFMKRVIERNRFDLLMIFLTDVINQESEVLFVGDKKEIITSAFGVEVEENSAHLPGIVSRKKQVIPMLSAAMEKVY